MYKTVRHGENSLQYTILPQTEEVISNSGMKGKGRDYSPSIHVRRSRRRPTVKYILLVIFSIIVALAVASVPLYYLNNTLYARNQNQSHNDFITIVPLTPTEREIVKSRKKELKTTPEVVSTLQSKLEATTSTSKSLPTIPTVAVGKSTTPPWTMPALRSWKSSTYSNTVPPLTTEDNGEIPLIGTPSGSIRLLDHYEWKPLDVIIRPTITPEPITLSNILKHYSTSMATQKAAKKIEDVLITTKPTTIRTPLSTDQRLTSENSKMKDLKDTLLSVDDDEEFKESLEVDEVFSLPTMNPGDAGSDSDEVTVSKTGDGPWYSAKWPFVDPSSYFQWSGYSPGDNMLLPLLVSTLSSIALIILLAFAVRRRQRTQAIKSSNGRTNADSQADDVINLLNSDVPEDAQE